VAATPQPIIDLRSDTVTKPSPAMRDAMARAEVGDDVYGEDPTVNRLQEAGAALVGKRAALFVPSGTAGNQLCLRAQTEPGQEVIVEGHSHIVRYELGAAAALAGVQLHWVAGTRGLMTAEQVEAAIRPNDTYSIQSGLICLEQTHNAGGGTVYPLATIHAIREVASAHGLPMHLDGARLLNAVVASGVSAAEYAQHFETVTFCLSKGLAAPVGSVLCGSRDFIQQARVHRQYLGGTMRQAGIIAAAGIVALETMIDRLPEDHANAKYLAEGFAQIPGITLPYGVETNLVFIDVSGTGMSAQDVATRLDPGGVRLGAFYEPSILRAVTHYEITREDCDIAIAELDRLVASVPVG